MSTLNGAVSHFFSEEHESKTRKKNINNTVKKIPHYIKEYENYLFERNYALSTISAIVPRTIKFSRDCERLFDNNFESLEAYRNLSLEDVRSYEEHLIKRVLNREIKDETAYSCIKSTRIFLKFLLQKEIINFDYKIPKKFIVQPKRSNAYSSKEAITEVIESLVRQNSPLKYRDLGIFLIFVDTGCRPIEVSNLKTSDLNLTEKRITIYSIKSGKRTLILNDLVVQVLKKYMKMRKELFPKSDYLFLKKNGEHINSSYLSSLISTINRKTFGRCIINATALRHTYITNAIENNNDFKEISEAVGHKHWVSTIYYLHRSKHRLISNTLKFDPIIKFLEE